MTGNLRIHMEDRSLISRRAFSAFAVPDTVMERAFGTHVPHECRLFERAADLLVDATAGLRRIDCCKGACVSLRTGPALPKANIEKRPVWTFAKRR